MNDTKYVPPFVMGEEDVDSVIIEDANGEIFIAALKYYKDNVEKALEILNAHFAEQPEGFDVEKWYEENITELYTLFKFATPASFVDRPILEACKLAVKAAEAPLHSKIAELEETITELTRDHEQEFVDQALKELKERREQLGESDVDKD